MSRQLSFEEFQADMYMKAMAELAPILRDAMDRVQAVYDDARDAVVDLHMVQRQIDVLNEISSYGEADPAAAIHEAMTVDLLVYKQMRDSFVYFIEAEGFIKIGYSRDPIIRLGQIRRGQSVAAPEGISTSAARLLAVEQGDRSTEKSLHKRFAEHRVAGEWFEKNDRLAHYIKSIATPA